MQYLTRETLDANPPRLGSEEVTVRWTDDSGNLCRAKVIVVEMSVEDRSRFDRMVIDYHQARLSDAEEDGEDSSEGVRQALAIACARTPERAPIWTPDDIETVSAYGSGFIEPIVNAAQRLNHVTDLDIDDLAKNSEATGPADS